MLAPVDPVGQCVRPPPPPTVVGGEENYEVQSILDSRLRAGRLEFLVSWKGYRYEENSWVSKHDVSAPQLISHFYRDNPGAPHHIRTLHFGGIHFCPTLPIP